MAEDGIQGGIPGKPGPNKIPWGNNVPCSTFACEMRRYKDWIVSTETTKKIGGIIGGGVAGAACTGAAVAAKAPLENKAVAGAIAACVAGGVYAGEAVGGNEYVNEFINSAIPTGMVQPPDPPVSK